MPNGLSYLNSLDRSISNLRGVGSVFIITMFYRYVFKVNSVDPDQTPLSVACDLGLYCLSKSLLWDARPEWFNSVTG